MAFFWKNNGVNIIFVLAWHTCNRSLSFIQYTSEGTEISCPYLKRSICGEVAVTNGLILSQVPTSTRTTVFHPVSGHLTIWESGNIVVSYHYNTKYMHQVRWGVSGSLNFIRLLWVAITPSAMMFPASRGLSQQGKNERKEIASLSFLLFLPHCERPLLAQK